MDATRRDLLKAGAAAPLAWANPVKAESAASRPLSRWVWDLDSEFPTEAAWEAQVSDVRRQLSGLTPPTSGWSARLFDELYARTRAVRQRAGHVARFAVLKAIENEGSEVNLLRRDEATALEAAVEQQLSWLDPAILAIGQDNFDRWARQTPALERHRTAFERVLARGMNPRTELRSLLAKADRWPRSSADIYEAILSADPGWASVEVSPQQTVTADPSAFRTFRRSGDALARHKVAQAYLTKLKEFEDVFGLLYTDRLDGDRTIAQARGYADALDASLIGEDGLAPGMAARLAAIRVPAGLMRRWSRVVARYSGTSDADWGDLQARPLSFSRPIPIGLATTLAADALKPLGPGYSSRLAVRWNQSWFHLPPLPDKASEVGVFWQVGGGHPYGVMTFRDDLASSATFASLSALAMWYADLPAAVLGDRREEDFPVFSNAVWFAARLLHHDALLERTRRAGDRHAILLDDLAFLNRGLSYVAAAVLARDVEASIATGSPMRGGDISRAWLATLRRLFEGVEVPEVYGPSWIAEPQAFYNESLSVFAIAMGVAAELAERLRAGDRRAAEALSLVRVGRGRHSADFLEQVGIDVSTDGLADALFRRVDRALLELERAA